MDRVRGWYTRFTRLILLVIGAVLVIVINADSINVATTLWREAPIRAAVVEQAGAVVAEGHPGLERQRVPLAATSLDVGEGGHFLDTPMTRTPKEAEAETDVEVTDLTVLV
jgi:hypothetical protein